MAPLETQTFDGLAGGMNLAIPAHMIDDTQARYLQDILLDYPGFLRRRGPVREAAGFPTFANKGCGITGTINPGGNYRVGVFTGDNATGQFRMLSGDFASFETFTWFGALPASPPSNPYRIVDSKPALGGGVGLGTSAQYSISTPVQALGFWQGGNKDDYSTGTITLTRGSVAVTGSGTLWSAELSPGMYLFADVVDTTNTGRYVQTLIGVIESIQSNTALTLQAVSPYGTSGSAYLATSVRGLQYKIAKGRITTTTASTTVTGAQTKFVSQFMDEVVASRTGSTSSGSPIVTALSQTSDLKVGMRVTGTNIAANSIIITIDSASQITLNNNATGTGSVTLTFKHAWNLYRASDMAWIGRVSLVNNDISITLVANATVALNNERFFALCGTGDWTLDTVTALHKVGFLNAVFAGRQWYANNAKVLEGISRVWFSETSDPEALDLSDFDGDFINAVSTVDTDTPIKAIMPAYNSLVVIKENEAFAITGTSPSTFTLKKVFDDGTLSGMSTQSYGGGVIWAGREGIHFYDGIATRNLTQELLGDYYKNAIRNINPQNHRMWSMVSREHYFLFIESLSPNVPVIKGITSNTPSATTIMINMSTGAVSLLTNLALRGFVETPADTGKHGLYIVNDSVANICDSFDLFDVDGVDTILCDGNSAGKFSFGVTALGSSTSFNGVADTKYFSKITTTARSAVESIRVYTEGQGGGSANHNVRAGIYSDVSGSPSALLGSTSVVVLKQDDGPAFREFAFTTPVEIAAGAYWIGVQVETSGRVKFFQGATANAMASNADTYSDGLSDPFGSVTNNNGPLVAYAFVRSVGPDFYIESKKFSEGDSMRRKRFKQLGITYFTQGDTLRMDTVLGLQNIGKQAASSFPITVLTWDQLSTLAGSWDALTALFPTWDTITEAQFKPKRIKFLKRAQLMSFRIYQNSPAVTRCQIGPMQIAWRWARPGVI